MLEAIVQPSLEVDIVHSPIPVPGRGEVLIRVVCSGCNPKDWKSVVFSNHAMNSGDDIAGIVASVGSDVIAFKKGDRVAALHRMRTAAGSFAEFAIAPATTTFHLPSKVSFEEGSTIPLAALTAAIGLYHSLELNPPWQPATRANPLIVYGASSAVGAYAVKLACRSNIHPIIAVGGAGRAMVEKIIDISKGDVVLDYREGQDAVLKEIRQTLTNQGLSSVDHAFDCISEKGSLELLSEALAQNGHATFVLPEKDYTGPAKTLRTSITYVGYVHTGPFATNPKQGINYNPSGRGEDFGFVFSNLFSKALEDGWFHPHPYKVVPGGLKGLPTALRSLKEGTISAAKYVIRIEETPS